MNKIKILTFFVALLGSSIASAFDSWYVINNYIGAIGRYPIHISIQYYDTGGGVI